MLGPSIHATPHARSLRQGHRGPSRHYPPPPLEALGLAELTHDAKNGGDEFAIILPNTDLDGAARVGARILASLAAEHVGGPDAEIAVRCSLGASTLSGRSRDPSEMVAPLSPAYFQGAAEALIRSADAAL